MPIEHRFVVIADRIAPGARVLDIGCGEGAFLRHLLTRVPDAVVFGADLASPAIDLLRGAGMAGCVIDPARPLRQQIEGAFDVVVMMEVIEHVHDAEGLVRQALAFQPRRLFITVPNVGYVMHRLRLMFGGRFPVTTVLYHMKEHIRFWTVRDFYQWAGTVGLEVCDHVGQEKTKRLWERWLVRLCPSLFAGQMIYECRPVA